MAEIPSAETSGPQWESRSYQASACAGIHRRHRTQGHHPKQPPVHVSVHPNGEQGRGGGLFEALVFSHLPRDPVIVSQRAASCVCVVLAACAGMVQCRRRHSGSFLLRGTRPVPSGCWGCPRPPSAATLPGLVRLGAAHDTHNTHYVKCLLHCVSLSAQTLAAYSAGIWCATLQDRGAIPGLE